MQRHKWVYWRGEASFIRYERTILTLNRCDRLAFSPARQIQRGLPAVRSEYNKRHRHIYILFMACTEEATITQDSWGGTRPTSQNSLALL